MFLRLKSSETEVGGEAFSPEALRVKRSIREILTAIKEWYKLENLLFANRLEQE